jgi:hypothetical protein
MLTKHSTVRGPRRPSLLTVPLQAGSSPNAANLGVESHDNLCDALVWLIQGLVEQGLELPKIHWIEA